MKRLCCFSLIPLLTLLLISCEDPMGEESSGLHNVEGLWRIVAIEEDGIKTTIALDDTLSEIRRFENDICSSYYNSSFPNQSGDYSKQFITDTTMEWDSYSERYVRTGAIRNFPYTLHSDTLKIEQKSITGYYVRYEGDFPPAVWDMYEEKLERNSFVGNWIIYDTTSDGTYQIILEFHDDKRYFEISQYIESDSYLPDHAFEPDTHYGWWNVENRLLNIYYNELDSTHTHPYEISSDSLKFNLWGEEWGDSFKRLHEESYTQL